MRTLPFVAAGALAAGLVGAFAPVWVALLAGVAVMLAAAWLVDQLREHRR